MTVLDTHDASERPATPPPAPPSSPDGPDAADGPPVATDSTPSSSPSPPSDEPLTVFAVAVLDDSLPDTADTDLDAFLGSPPDVVDPPDVRIAPVFSPVLGAAAVAAPASTPDLVASIDPASNARHSKVATRVDVKVDHRDAFARSLWRFSVVVIAVELLAMVAWSTFQWHRGADGPDLADFNQPAWLIIHGHLNPYLTVTGRAEYFLQDHFSLLFYPLCFFYLFHQSGVTLLYLQDIAFAATALVGIRWIAEMLGDHLDSDRPLFGRRTAIGIVVGALLVFGFNPWVWQAISFDFHMEAFAALFLILAARAFWRGEIRAAYVFVALDLLVADYTDLYIVALGLTLLIVGRGRLRSDVEHPPLRRHGLRVVGLGVAWMVFVTVLGVARGDNLVSYSYVLNGIVQGSPAAAAAHMKFHAPSMPQLLFAMVFHPSHWIHMLTMKSTTLFQNIVPTGIFSLLSPWSLPVMIVVLIPAALVPPPIFLDSGFQTMPTEILGLCGTVFGLLWFGRRIASRFGLAAARILLGIAGAVILVQFSMLAYQMLPGISARWIQVSTQQGQAIATVENMIPTTAEVVASGPIVGHFTGRQYAYVQEHRGDSFPIRSSTVYFVLAPKAGNIPITPPEGVQEIQAALNLGAHKVYLYAGIHVLVWHPTTRVQRITLLPQATPATAAAATATPTPAPGTSAPPTP